MPYTLTLLFPIASGASSGLLAGVAQDYGVNGHQMAWMNGLAGALLMALGAMAATLIPARVRASVGYLLVGIVNAATLGILWLGPLRPSTYYVGVALYLFTIGTAQCDVYRGDSGVPGEVGEEWEWEVFDHQFDGECAGGLYDGDRRVGR